MRLPIYKKDDFFGTPDDQMFLVVEGLLTETELPLCYYYRHDQPPIGKAVDIQLHLDENFVDCELEFFESADPMLRDLVPTEDGYLNLVNKEHNYVELQYRLGGYYDSTVIMTRDGKRMVEGCILREVSIIPEPAWPSSEKNARRGGNPGVKL